MSSVGPSHPDVGAAEEHRRRPGRGAVAGRGRGEDKDVVRGDRQIVDADGLGAVAAHEQLARRERDAVDVDGARDQLEPADRLVEAYAGLPSPSISVVSAPPVGFVGHGRRLEAHDVLALEREEEVACLQRRTAHRDGPLDQREVVDVTAGIAGVVDEDAEGAAAVAAGDRRAEQDDVPRCRMNAPGERSVVARRQQDVATLERDRIRRPDDHRLPDVVQALNVRSTCGEAVEAEQRRERAVARSRAEREVRVPELRDLVLPERDAAVTGGDGDVARGRQQQCVRRRSEQHRRVVAGARTTVAVREDESNRPVRGSRSAARVGVGDVPDQCRGRRGCSRCR